MTTTGRLAPRRGDDSGSAIAVLPILVLLLVGAVAALIGVALQPSDTPAQPEPPTITAAQLGGTCLTDVGQLPARPLARERWLRSLASCVNDRIEGALGDAANSTNSGYGGIVVTRTFNGRPAVVVNWTRVPPAVVAGWAAQHGNGLVVVVGPAAT